MRQIITFCTAVILFFSACQSAYKLPKNPSSADYYTEQHRPQFHFSPEKAWMNDPNGLVYYKGEYHLFYQYYPDSTVWGPMHWGHAISRDLVHWTHLPIALYPDSLGCIFSGSIVVDENNTTGFQTGTEKPLVAIFTYHNLDWEKAGRLDRESQGIAYSLDRGRTWTKYAGNPVIKNKGDVDFRDPKVFFHAPTQRWIMPLAVGDYLEIFTSPNLKDWTFASRFGEKEGAHGGVWECPDLFPLPTEGGGEKWVLIQNMGRGAVNGGSGTQYFIGSFDGKVFKNDNAPDKVLWLDYGADNYAGVTWTGNTDGRKLFIGWMSNWDDYATKVPTEKWRSAMTVVRSLSLKKEADGYKLYQMPVKELEKLRGKGQKIKPAVFAGERALPLANVSKEIHIKIDVKNTTAADFGIALQNNKGENLRIGIDKAQGTVYIDRTQAGKSDFSTKFAKRHTAPLPPTDTIDLKIWVDAASVEVFVNEGRLSLTDVFFPTEDYTQAYVFALKGTVAHQGIKVYPLASIWRR